MPLKKNHWGWVFCAGSIVLLSLIFWAAAAFPPGQNRTLYRHTLPFLGLLFSAFVLFFGHFSYSRIHSVRVYFLGYSAGLVFLFYFLTVKPFLRIEFLPKAPAGLVEFLIVTAGVNILISALIPQTAKYRITRGLTLGIVTAQTVLLLILRFTPNHIPWLTTFSSSRISDPTDWVSAVLLALCFAAAIWKIRGEFFLGGVAGGAVILLAASWLCRPLMPGQAEILRLMIFAACGLLLSAGFIVHGFSRMEHRLSYDPLLRIFNREYCTRIITEQANMNVAPPFAVAMVDIDHFKQVNDTYGHQAGDAVLHAVAQNVQHGAGTQGIPCRYGGEELAVFFPQTTIQAAAEIIEEIRISIEKMKTSSGRKKIAVTVSAGISARESYSQSIADVIAAADKALYSAKNNGRNQVKTQKTPLAVTRKQAAVV